MKIHISTHNTAAFDDNPNELNRILLEAQRRIEAGERGDFPLYDSRGDVCGYVQDARKED